MGRGVDVDDLIDLRSIRWSAHPRGEQGRLVEFETRYPLEGDRAAAKRAAGLLGSDETPFEGEIVLKQLGTRRRTEWSVRPTSFRFRRVIFADFEIHELGER